MKNVLLAIVSAALVSGVLYGLLSAVDHPAAEPEDPWLEMWQAEGLHGQFVSVSSEPERHLMFSDGRELMKGPEFRETALRRYIVQNVTLQVVMLPKPGLAPELPEGRHFTFRLKEKGSGVHLCRVGKTLLLVRTQTNWIPIPGVGEPPTPKPLVTKFFDVFEKAAARFP